MFLPCKVTATVDDVFDRAHPLARPGPRARSAQGMKGSESRQVKLRMATANVLTLQAGPKARAR
eukprot:15140378-Alexandrium_andersonii.AAC.1